MEEGRAKGAKARTGEREKTLRLSLRIETRMQGTGHGCRGENWLFNRGELAKQMQGKCLGTQKHSGSKAGKITRMQGEIKLMQIQ